MTVQAHTDDRRLVVLAVLGVVLALTAAMWTLAGCAPKAEPSAPAASEQKDGNGGSSAMDGQPVNWTMDSDCSMCHTSEAESATDAACPQATAHEAEGVACAQCHTDEGELSAAHADVKFGDKPASKPTMVTVDPATCESCHGTLEDMAAKTADSTALTDDKGTTVNPPRAPRRREARGEPGHVHRLPQQPLQGPPQRLDAVLRAVPPPGNLRMRHLPRAPRALRSNEQAYPPETESPPSLSVSGSSKTRPLPRPGLSRWDLRDLALCRAPDSVSS